MLLELKDESLRNHLKGYYYGGLSVSNFLAALVYVYAKETT